MEFLFCNKVIFPYVICYCVLICGIVFCLLIILWSVYYREQVKCTWPKQITSVSTCNEAKWYSVCFSAALNLCWYFSAVWLCHVWHLVMSCSTFGYAMFDVWLCHVWCLVMPCVTFGYATFGVWLCHVWRLVVMFDIWLCHLWCLVVMFDIWLSCLVYGYVMFDVLLCHVWHKNAPTPSFTPVCFAFFSLQCPLPVHITS